MRHDEILANQSRKRLLDKQHLLPEKACLSDVCKKVFHRPVSIFKCCLMILTIALCSQIFAQSTSTQRKLTSFCGFKSGEVKKSDRGIDEPIRTRIPFRKLRDVRLVYSPKGRLQSVEASAFIDKMKPDSGRKELDLCCKELARYGIRFPEDWNIDNDGNVLSKNGSGDGVDVHITGNLAAEQSVSSGSSKIRNGTLITIGVDWKDIDLDAITPIVGSYNAKSKHPRQMFVERVFGVKFGEKIPYSESTERLTCPICGMSRIYFRNNVSRKLQSMILQRVDTAPKSVADIKSEYNRLYEEVKNWLSITDYSLANFTNRHQSMYTVSSFYVDESIFVKVSVSWTQELDSSNFTVTIREASEGDKEVIKQLGKSSALSADDNVTEQERRMKPTQVRRAWTEQERQIEKYMSTTLIPSVRFYSQDTLKDVIDFLQKTSKELDTRKLPESQRGLKFDLQIKPGTNAPTIPNFGVSNISILELLNHICQMVKPQYTFEVKGQTIIVKPLEPRPQEP